MWNDFLERWKKIDPNVYIDDDEQRFIVRSKFITIEHNYECDDTTINGTIFMDSKGMWELFLDTINEITIKEELKKGEKL